MPIRASGDGAALPAVDVGNLRGDDQRSRPPEEVAHSVAAITADRSWRADAAPQYRECRCALGLSFALVDFHVNDQTVPVRGQDVAHVAEQGTPLSALGLKSRRGLGGRNVRLAAAALAAELRMAVVTAAQGGCSSRVRQLRFEA